ncbi:hypothetical protein OC844_004308 [Tilletia horrida]|nr:hypothetical protein OC844_004308 [Tilletia horrida]
MIRGRNVSKQILDEWVWERRLRASPLLSSSEREQQQQQQQQQHRRRRAIVPTFPTPSEAAALALSTTDLTGMPVETRRKLQRKERDRARRAAQAAVRNADPSSGKDRGDVAPPNTRGFFLLHDAGPAGPSGGVMAAADERDPDDDGVALVMDPHMRPAMWAGAAWAKGVVGASCTAHSICQSSNGAAAERSVSGAAAQALTQSPTAITSAPCTSPTVRAPAVSSSTKCSTHTTPPLPPPRHFLQVSAAPIDLRDLAEVKREVDLDAPPPLAPVLDYVEPILRELELELQDAAEAAAAAPPPAVAVDVQTDRGAGLELGEPAQGASLDATPVVLMQPSLSAPSYLLPSAAHAAPGTGTGATTAVGTPATSPSSSRAALLPASVAGAKEGEVPVVEKAERTPSKLGLGLGLRFADDGVASAAAATAASKDSAAAQGVLTPSPTSQGVLTPSPTSPTVSDPSSSSYFGSVMLGLRSSVSSPSQHSMQMAPRSSSSSWAFAGTAHSSRRRGSDHPVRIGTSSKKGPTKKVEKKQAKPPQAPESVRISDIVKLLAPNSYELTVDNGKGTVVDVLAGEDFDITSLDLGNLPTLSFATKLYASVQSTLTGMIFDLTAPAVKGPNAGSLPRGVAGNPPQVKMLDRVERGAKQQTRANMSQSVATLKETGREETARVARAKRAKAARAKEGSAPPTASAMGKAKSTCNKREAVALSAAAATATSAATVAAAAKVAAAKAMAAAARAAAEAAVAEAVAAEAEAAATEAEAATAATTPTPTPTPRSRTTAAPPPPKLKAATAAKSKTKKASKSKTAAAARPKAKKAAAKASKSKTAAAEALATSAESRAGKKGKEATTEEADSTSPKRQFAELEETTDAEGRTLVHYEVYDIHAIRIVDGKRQMYLQYRGWTDIENLGDQAGAELQAQQLVQRQGGYVPRPDVDNAPGILSSAGPLQAISDHAAEDTTPISPPLSPHRAAAVLPPLSLQRFMPTASAPAIGVPTRDASNACPDADSDTDYDELDDEADDKVSTGSIPSATLSC